MITRMPTTRVTVPAITPMTMLRVGDDDDDGDNYNDAGSCHTLT